MAQAEPRTLALDFHLLCIDERFSDAFSEAVKSKFPDFHQKVSLKIHESDLASLDPSLAIDAVVSPANSYARLDGAFDDALAQAYGPTEDYGWITRKAQAFIYKQWRGFAPPGTCTVIPLSNEQTPGSAPDNHAWGTKYLLLCPTMPVPWDAKWDREVVYECVWSMLCAVEQHNKTAKEDTRIKSILMPPLATGVGRIRPQRWAEQCVLAIKHWIEAVEKPQLWSRLEWQDIYIRQDEIEATFIDDVPGQID